MNTLTKITVLSLATVSCLFAGTAPTVYPGGELGRMVKLGEDILANTDTHPLTKDFVGNKLQCTSCHLKGEDGKAGTSTGMSTFIGTATVFPAYSKREQTVQTLQDRANNCFMRSMDGKRLVVDSEASVAIAAYITWLSTGMPIQMNEKAPVSPLSLKAYASGQKKFEEIQRKATNANYLNGHKVYDEKCAACHGQNGEGMGAFPPLWGKDIKGQSLSYNTGAGMSKLTKAPVWVQSNMPFGQGGTLSDQEAADVVIFFDAQERANFDLEKSLLPKEQMGVYNSKVFSEKHSVRSNFKAFGLNIDEIRGDKIIK